MHRSHKTCTTSETTLNLLSMEETPNFMEKQDTLKLGLNSQIQICYSADTCLIQSLNDYSRSDYKKQNLCVLI
jgi:hypothetical protein